MLDREVVKDFLEEELGGEEIPEGVLMEDLTEAFCQYVEDDYYEWLKNNFKSFFSNGWDWIEKRIKTL